MDWKRASAGVSTFITESELREFWRNGAGKIPAFPPGTRFSASAQDFLKAQGIELPEEAQRHLGGDIAERIGSTPSDDSGCVKAANRRLDALEYLRRISGRGKIQCRLESLQALLGLASSQARRFQLPAVEQALEGVAAYCRDVATSERELRPPGPLVLRGQPEDEWARAASDHRGPQDAPPATGGHELLHWLNVVRTQALEAEIVALEAYPPDRAELWGVGEGIARALDRIAAAAHALGALVQGRTATGKDR